jgi:hypothetical protein
MINKEDFIKIALECLSLFLVLIGFPVMFYNMGHFHGKKEAKNKTTISCMEKPNECKELYNYIKLSEKLGKAP